MVTRIISALVGVPILIGILVMGGPVLISALGFVMLMGLNEFYRSLKSVKIYPIHLVGYGYVALWAFGSFIGQDYRVMGIYLALVLTTAVLLGKEERKVMDGVFTLFGIFYVVILLSYIALLDQHDTPYVIWLVFIIAFATDTFAYFSGMFFGKNKLCPRVSPKKTVEGALGGIVGTIVVCSLFGIILFDGTTGLLFALLGGVGSMVAQMGDLMASMLKRWTGIKDFGKIMPGHGGVLDRFDSILFAGPLVYYFVILLEI